MRRLIPFMLICAMPVNAAAYEAFIIGNTVVPGLPSILLANGKGYGKGRGDPAPAPAPSPAPAPAATPSEGRAESGFTYQPFRVQVEGPSTLPAPTPLPVQGEVPPLVTVQPLASPAATLSIPVQVLWHREQIQRRMPVDPGYGIPAIPSPCPTCPEVTPVPTPVPQTYMMPAPRQYRVCNALGQCIPWP